MAMASNLITNISEIKEMELNMLENSKEESSAYYRDYGYNLISFFCNLPIEKRNMETDKLVLRYMLYGIKHYQTFEKNCEENDYQQVTFNICRVVPFLTGIELMGKEGLIDKYTIKNHTGFEDINIFKDLKFLQKVVHPFPLFKVITKEEMKHLLEDMVGTLKQIIELELSDNAPDKPFKVSQYNHIFSIAAYYREGQRSNDAIKNLDIAIKVLDKNTENYSSEEKLYLVLRVLAVVGEFSTQKNLTLQTKLDNPQLDCELTVIKELANLIAKPEGYYANLDSSKILSLNFDGIKSNLEYLKSSIEQAMTKAEDKKASYDERLKYYITEKTTKPYLSEELIQELKQFTMNFPEINGDELEKLHEKFLSAKSIRYVGEITKKAQSVLNKEIYKERMKLITTQHNELLKMITSYKPSVQSIPNVQIQDIKTLLSVLEYDSKMPKPTTLILDQLQSFIKGAIKSACSSIPNVSPDDLWAVQYDKCYISTELDINYLNIHFILCPDDKLTKEKDLRKKPGRIKFYQVSYVVPLERVEAIKKAIELIEQYNTNIKYIYVPKKILEMGDELKNDVGIDTELINHFIEYGKYCELYTYFTKPIRKSTISIPNVSRGDFIALQYNNCSISTQLDINYLNINYISYCVDTLTGKKIAQPKLSSIKLPRNLEIVKAVKEAIELIEQRNTNINKCIYVPKEFDEDQSKVNEFLNHFIEYGKYCELYTYFVKPCNKLILEFYLQTTYNLLEGINEQDPFFITNKEEYRILRNVLRHFEDNFDVLEQQRPVEEIYIHYAVKYLQEVKKTEKGTLAKCITA